MNAYLDQIKGKIDLLKRNKNVTVSEFSYGPGLADHNFVDIEKQLTIVLPEDLKSVFSAFNGLQVEWKYTDNSGSYNGYLNIPSIFDSLGLASKDNTLFFNEKHFEGLLWDQYLEEEEMTGRKKFKLIESLNGADGDFCYLLSDSSFTEIYFLDKWKIVNTGGTLKDYIDFVISTIGMQNLRYCFIEKAKLTHCLSLKPESEILSGILK